MKARLTDIRFIPLNNTQSLQAMHYYLCAIGNSVPAGTDEKNKLERPEGNLT